MPSARFLTAAAFLLLLAAFAIRRAYRTRYRARLLRTLRPTPLAEASAFTQVEGVVESDQPLTAPISREPAAYYAFRVEEPRPDRPRPRRLAVGKQFAPARIRDATGQADLPLSSATVRSPHQTTKDLGRLETIPPEWTEFFEQAGIDPKHLPRFEALRLVEFRLAPGDRAFVTGTLRTEPDAKTFYRDGRSAYVVSPTPDTGLIPGLQSEVLLFSATAALFVLFAALFLVAGLA